jgi:rSAM/selenodomain-associated transferase 1
MDARVIVFAKAAVPGEVKTRLARTLGDDAAARLYRAFLSDTLRSIFTAPGLAGTLACAPAPDAHLASLAGRWNLALDAQRGEGLHARLCDATRAARAKGARDVLFIGSDTPTLPRAFVDSALARLGRADVVFGPSFDGGYTLVALGPAAEPEALFRDVPWDSDRALAATRANAERAGRRVAFVPAWYDIDEPADLAYLRGHLTHLDPAGPGGAPETRGVLRDLSI